MFILLWTLLSTTFLQADPPTECITLSEYLQTMRDFPLEDLPLFHVADQSPAGSIERLDATSSPPVLSLKGAGTSDLSALCIRTRDLEKGIVYQINLVEHDFDGMACVAFDEGKPHSRLFQREEHNRGREIVLHPYRRGGEEWKRVDAQSGFFHEAFSFECGVEVGAPGILGLLKHEELESGQQLLRADSPLANEAGFEKLVEVKMDGVGYWLGRGIELGE